MFASFFLECIFVRYKYVLQLNVARIVPAFLPGLKYN
jgi:hypothetical protein